MKIHLVSKIRNMYYEFQFKHSYIGKYIEFVWGRSACGGEASLYQSNYIDIVYDNKTKLYMLGLETAFLMDDGKVGECAYLEEMLEEFTKFMTSKNLNTNSEHVFFLCEPKTELSATTVEDLYTNFRIFVEGYVSVYGGKHEK